MPYFPLFLSLYATGSQVPGSFSNDEDDQGDQGYSDDETPTSPEAYDPEDQQTSRESSTPVGSYAPSCLSAYEDDPYGGWRPLLPN